MSLVGVVRAWSKGYGFAECKDGRTVFVHHKEIGHGNRLRVGAELSFDIEENEGHDGRVKARNVTGPGIVTWAEWKKSAPTQEEREKEREEWDSYKKEQLGYEEGTGHASVPAKQAGGKKKKGNEGEDNEPRVVSSAGAATGSGVPPAPVTGKQPGKPVEPRGAKKQQTVKGQQREFTQPQQRQKQPLTPEHNHGDHSALPAWLQNFPWAHAAFPMPGMVAGPPMPPPHMPMEAQPFPCFPPAVQPPMPLGTPVEAGPIEESCRCCGAGLMGGARFCHQCGESCAPPVCGRCGTTFAQADAAFCHRCGQPSAGRMNNASLSTPPPPAATPPPPVSLIEGRSNASVSPHWEDGRSRKSSEGSVSPRTSCMAVQSPWLEMAGLPVDGSVCVAQELDAFAAFQGATASERARRAAVRTSLQKLVQLTVCPEATVKLIGGWATDLTAYDSALDLVLEAPEMQDPLGELRCYLAGLGVMGTMLEVTPAGGMRALVLNAAELTAALSEGQVAAKVHDTSFDVNVHMGPPGSAARSSTAIVRGAVARIPLLRPCLVALRAALRHLGSKCMGGHLITLLALAFFERCRHLGISDPGAVFCEFFRFYSAFDFGRFSVCPFPRDGGEVYPLKAQQDMFLEVIDPAGTATTVGLRAEYAPLTATCEYFTQVIERYEAAKRAGSASGLLASVIPATQLEPRRDFLRKRKGLEPSKELAVAIARGVADFLEDPRNQDARKQYLEMATWDTVQGMVRDARLLRKVVDTPGSELAALREYVPDMQRCLESYSQDPEVKELEKKSVATTVSHDTVTQVLEEVASFLEQPECGPEGGMRTQLLEMCAQKGCVNGSVADALFGQIAQMQPGSQLSKFQEMVPAILTAMEAHNQEPAFKAALGRVFSAAVDQGLMKLMTQEVILFLRDPENKTVIQETLRDTADQEGWNAGAPLLLKIAEQPGTLVSMFKSHIPLLVEVLQNRYYDAIASGSADPELCRLVSTAATSCVTKEVALHIAGLVCNFLEDPANDEIKQEVVKTSETDTTDKLVRTHTALFEKMAEQPGSPLAMYRHNIADLVDVMDSFHGDPEIDAARRRAARAIITKDVADLMLRDVAEMFESDGLQEGDILRGSGSRGWRATAASVYENLESRVSQDVFAKLCEESQMWRARVKQAGGVSSVADAVSRLMKDSVIAFADEPELRALRRRAAQAAAGGGYNRAGSESEAPPDLESDFPESDGFYTPPDTPVSSALRVRVVSPDSESSCPQEAPVCPPIEVVAADAARREALFDIEHPPSAPQSLFTPVDTIRSQENASVHRIEAPFAVVFSTALSDDPRGPLHNIHAQRGDVGLAPGPWACSGDPATGGVRSSTHEAMTPLGRHACNEGQRWVLAPSASGKAVLTLHWSSQVTGVPLGGLFRTETLYDFTEQEDGSVQGVCRVYVDATALGMMSHVVRSMAMAAAAEVGASFIRNVSRQAQAVAEQQCS
eukprot:Hpha_TRINITY_DN16436_c0_g5::TRINITY_DN16436_c0_g5_i1::g.164090::m.164090